MQHAYRLVTMFFSLVIVLVGIGFSQVPVANSQQGSDETEVQRRIRLVRAVRANPRTPLLLKQGKVDLITYIQERQTKLFEDSASGERSDAEIVYRLYNLTKRDVTVLGKIINGTFRPSQSVLQASTSAAAIGDAPDPNLSEKLSFVPSGDDTQIIRPGKFLEFSRYILMGENCNSFQRVAVKVRIGKSKTVVLIASDAQYNSSCGLVTGADHAASSK